MFSTQQCTLSCIYLVLPAKNSSTQTCLCPRYSAMYVLRYYCTVLSPVNIHPYMYSHIYSSWETTVIGTYWRLVLTNQPTFPKYTSASKAEDSHVRGCFDTQQPGQGGCHSLGITVALSIPILLPALTCWWEHHDSFSVFSSIPGARATHWFS